LQVFSIVPVRIILFPFKILNGETKLLSIHPNDVLYLIDHGRISDDDITGIAGEDARELLSTVGDQLYGSPILSNTFPDSYSTEYLPIAGFEDGSS
jgi:hypothetical protein